jgi:hypothetical protein
VIWVIIAPGRGRAVKKPSGCCHFSGKRHGTPRHKQAGHLSQIFPAFAGWRPSGSKGTSMKASANQTAFRLSRIYAQGWNAARGPEADEPVNPYPAEPERERWAAGFAHAQTKSIRKIR